jgi:hypothetical protein
LELENAAAALVPEDDVSEALRGRIEKYARAARQSAIAPGIEVRGEAIAVVPLPGLASQQHDSQTHSVAVGQARSRCEK